MKGRKINLHLFVQCTWGSLVFLLTYTWCLIASGPSVAITVTGCWLVYFIFYFILLMLSPLSQTGFGFTKDFYQMGWESEKKNESFATQMRTWGGHTHFPHCSQGPELASGGRFTWECGRRVWQGRGGGMSLWNSLFPRAQFGYQRTKMMLFHQVHLLKSTWFRELKRWNLILGSLRAPLLSQSKAIIHVVRAEVLYNLKQMESFSHCNLETTSPCGPKGSWKLE